MYDLKKAILAYVDTALKRDVGTLELDRARANLIGSIAPLLLLEDAVIKFLAKYDQVKPEIDNAFLMEQIHGRPYRGPNFGLELAQLRALVSPAQADEMKDPSRC